MREGSTIARPYAGALSDQATRRQFVGQVAGALFASGAAASVLAACGGDEKQATEGGVSGTINVLAWAGYDAPKVSAPFRKRHGVTVRSEVLSTTADTITKLLGGGARTYSLVSPPIAQVPAQVAAGVLDPMDYGKLANAKDYIPHFATLGQETFAVGGKAYAAPYLWGINAMIYNEKYLPKPPKSWMDFTKPEFKNKIALTDVPEDNYQTWAQVLGYDPMGMSQAELDKVTDFLVDLKRNQARTFTNTYDDLAQQLASGDIVAVASPLWTAIPSFARKHGSTTVKWSLPAEGGSRTWTDTWVLPKDGRNQEAAYAWVDYMIGAEAQAKIATALQSGTVNQRAIPNLTGEAKTLYPYDDIAKLDEVAPPWELPLGENGSVTYTDWLTAWKRVGAA